MSEKKSTQCERANAPPKFDLVSMLAHGEVEIMFSLPNAFMPYDKPQLTGSLYFRVDDVTPLWEKVKDTAKVSYPLEDFSYGMREFAIFDPNGYLIQFGQEL